MWGMGDGSSDVSQGRRPDSEPSDVVGGAAAAGGAAGTMGRGGDASDAEIYGTGPGTRPDAEVTEGGEEAVRGRGYNEELGWGQDGWENDTDEVMEDPWQRGTGDGGGLFGNGGGDGGDWGDFGDWS